ncbi:hypothetical protein F183_A53160 [Bryobacterales bacterium F-183]|nr:hypothetical protein F183_A53160 [Bryobacterales bacterium F-183]
MYRYRPCFALSIVSVAASLAAEQPPPAAFQQYCAGCHGKAAMGGVNLEELLKSPPGEPFQTWDKVAAVLETKRMPPPKMKQPSDEERQAAAAWVRSGLKEYAKKHAGDPGKVTVRRLTSGEYGYTIEDLTGLDIKTDRDFVADSVGGEGFTNFGDVQFMQDANLERYLQAAKWVAERAVTASGPLSFYPDPGKSGLELSAVARIRKIHGENGFRATSGEGGKPFGTERYGAAILAVWKYKNRAALGKPKATIAEIAKADGVSARFAEHLWNTFQTPNKTYPTAVVLEKWNKFPTGNDLAAAKVASKDLQDFIVNYPRFLFGAGAPAAGGLGDERALIISDEEVQVKARQKIVFGIINRSRDKQPFARVYLQVSSVNPDSSTKPLVYWRNTQVRSRGADRAFGEPKALFDIIDEASRQRLGFGSRGAQPNEFVTEGEVATYFDIPTPDAGGTFSLTIEPEIGPGDSIVRCLLSDKENIATGRPISALVGDPKLPSYKVWKKNLLDFAANLPSNSHGEATPADKDPIPAPFNNVYNQPERDRYHVKVKYYRTDKFLYDKILSDAQRAELDHAWNDLLGSFEYHDQILDFLDEKFKLNLNGKNIAQLDDAFIRSLPEEPRKYVEPLKAHYNAVQDAHLSAQPGHLRDALELASKAWRRPLTPTEKQNLEAYYRKLRDTQKLDHDRAIRVLLTRILVAPEFLYRLEQTSSNNNKTKGLTSWELASRLSYFLWSSIPDSELRRAAAANELTVPAKLQAQVKRMLADPKARRFSTEFFGQWLGFYRFDQFTGVDNGRFPEFNDELKTAMYDEATSFFEYIVRQNRPVSEILNANYTFLNPTLAKHYGVKADVKGMEKVDNAQDRGGALRLGAVLAETSAPLRTSPVKRGDWVLRRILGTPTPPPPADAGSLPADEKAFGGLTLREKLKVHMRNATCAGCHTRIDPMGFPLEKYDPLGRVRASYSDGKPVEDVSTTREGIDIKGVEGLIAYLQNHEEQVLSNMSRKLIGFALGRTALASDQPLVETMVKAGNKASLTDFISQIVASRQFQYRRDEDNGNRAVAVLRPTDKGPRRSQNGVTQNE